MSPVGREPGSRIHLLKLGERNGAERATVAGGTVEGGIVENHRHSVGSEANIELDGVGSLANREIERRKGVLRGMAGGAPVRDYRPGGKVEEWVHRPTRGYIPVMSIADLRREYSRARLDESHVDPDPVAEFHRWFTQAGEAKVLEPNAMALATATKDGAPSVRMVLLKGYDERGFVFFTDYRSRKGTELEQNPQAALVFHWAELERQVRVTGSVSVVSREESEVYFQSRPRASRLSTWVSHQSQVISGRDVLDRGERQMKQRYPDEVPLPPHWGGFRVTPETVEFWQGRLNRLHDRLRYSRQKGGGWRLERLSP